MLFLMHLANTKYSFEFKISPCISHIILCGSQHPGSLREDLKIHHYYLYYSSAGHTGKSAWKGYPPGSSRLLAVKITLAAFDFYLYYGVLGLLVLFSTLCIQFLPKEREDAQVADTSPACLPSASKPIFTRNKELWVCTATHPCAMVQTQWLWIDSQVTSHIKDFLQTTRHCAAPATAHFSIRRHWE